MTTCSGCQRQQPGTDTLCLACIEDLSAWLRQIPDLYDELAHVRLPGSVRAAGPQTKTSAVHAPAPVRLEVLDLHDRGAVFAKLEVWAGQVGDVCDMCERLRHNLLSVPLWPAQESGDFYRTIKALCRELGRVVGEPQELPIGKCARPDPEGFQCRGQLFRTQDGHAVYCRRCGDKPELKEQEAWVTLEQCARVIGKPIETVRTWYKRGRLGFDPRWTDHARTQPGWTEPIGPQPPRKAWLPTAVRLANGATTTFPHSSDSVNHGSGAELSPLDRNQDCPPVRGPAAAMQRVGARLGSDADVLGQAEGPGNVTPPDVATSGKAVAPDPTQTGLAAGRQADQAGEADPTDHQAAGSAPASQTAGSGEAWRVDTTCDDPGSADGAS